MEFHIENLDWELKCVIYTLQEKDPHANDVIIIYIKQDFTVFTLYYSTIHTHAYSIHIYT